MELCAVFRQIFVLNFWISYAGVHVEKTLLAQHGFERVMELPSEPSAARILVEIDRCLDRPVIRRAQMKRTRIGIAEDIAVPFEHEIRVFFERRFDSPAEFLFARHIVFVCYRGVFYIRRIYFEQRRRIVGRCRADFYFISHFILPPLFSALQASSLLFQTE